VDIGEGCANIGTAGKVSFPAAVRRKPGWQNNNGYSAAPLTANDLFDLGADYGFFDRG
jgi:hypothetical protein